MTDAEKVAKLAESLRAAMQCLSTNDQGRCRGCGNCRGNHLSECRVAPVLRQAWHALSATGELP